MNEPGHTPMWCSPTSADRPGSPSPAHGHAGSPTGPGHACPVGRRRPPHRPPSAAASPTDRHPRPGPAAPPASRRRSPPPPPTPAPARPAPSCRAQFSGGSWSQRSPILCVLGGTPETYHLVGLRPGTATSKFYETRDILSPTARLRLGSAAPHTDPEQLTPARRLWSTVAPPRRPGTGPAPYERTVRHLIQSSRIAAPRISQGELTAGAVRRPRTRFHQVSPTAGSLRRVVTPSSSASNATGCGSLLAQWISPPTPAAIRQRPCQSMTPTALVRSGQVRIVRRVRCRRGRAAVAAAAVVGAAGRSSKSRVRPPSGSKPSRGSRPSPCPQAWRVDPGRVISCEEACEIVESVQNLPRTDEDR